MQEQLQKSLDEVYLKYGNNKVSPDQTELDPLAAKSIDEENPDSESEDEELRRTNTMKLNRENQLKNALRRREMAINCKNWSNVQL